MTPSRTRQVLFFIIRTLVVLLTLVTVTELICRHRERVNTALLVPAEYRKLPPKGISELRVFAFGGSTVYGEPVPKLAFVAQLQYWLRRIYPDRDVQIYNFGVQGTDTSYALKQMTRRLDDHPDLIIVITGHNEFLYRMDAQPDSWLARIREMLYWHSAALKLLRRRVRRVMEFRKDYVMPCQVAPWNRKSPTFDRRVTGFEDEMKLIIERASQKGVKLIVGTLPSNVSDWPPAYKKLPGRDQRYLDTVSQIQSLTREGNCREVSDALTAGLSSYPDDAMLYFLRGQLQSAMGNYTGARESFVKAKDLDPLPWRTLSQINSIIRRVASGVPGVYLVDLEKIYAEHARNGLVGFDLIADNAHGTPLGESLSAQALMQTMIQIGFLPSPGKGQDECCPVDTFLASLGYLQPGSPLHLRYLLANATYTMKTPFLNYDASRMYLLEAKQVDDNSWAVWANLATLSYLSGDTATGAKQLERATELHHGPLDVNDRLTTPYLKEALDYAAGRRVCR